MKGGKNMVIEFNDNSGEQTCTKCGNWYNPDELFYGVCDSCWKLFEECIEKGLDK